MDPDEVDEIKRYSPNGTKTLRACIRCRLIMTKEQFYDYGCPDPTCRGLLDMAGSEGRVVACTSASFQGFITLIRPGAFLSRFNGLENKRPGCYALTVQGKIPDYILNESEMERDEDVRSVRSKRSSKRGRLSLVDSESERGSELGEEIAKPGAPLDLDDDEDAPLVPGGAAAPSPKESPRLPAQAGTPNSDISFSLDASSGKEEPAAGGGGEPVEKKRKLIAQVSSASSNAKDVEGLLEPEGDGDA